MTVYKMLLLLINGQPISSPYFKLWLCTHTHANTHTYTHANTHTNTHTCKHTHIRTCKQTHMQTHTHTHMQTHTHANMQTHTHANTHTHMQIHTHTHTHTHANTHTHTHANTHLYIHMRTHAHVHTHANTQKYIHTHTHTHTHTQKQTHTQMHTHANTCPQPTWCSPRHIPHSKPPPPTATTTASGTSPWSCSLISSIIQEWSLLHVTITTVTITTLQINEIIQCYWWRSKLNEKCLVWYHIADVILTRFMFDGNSDLFKDCLNTQLPYSGLFSLRANFPEFHEWAYYLKKFILGWYMKFDHGLLLQKLARIQLCPDGL